MSPGDEQNKTFLSVTDKNQALTQAEIEKAADLLVRMQLGVEEEVPVIIIFQYAPQQYRVIDFTTEQSKRQAQDWLNTFRQQQSQRAVEYEINH